MEAASQPQSKNMLIAVMGATGSGKTTFISTLVESDIGIGHGLRSATATSTVHDSERPQGHNVKLIDTPGFNDTSITDSDVLRDIALVLTQAYHQGNSLAGIIYLHRITDIRVSGSSKKMMKVIQDLVGQKAFPRLVLVTTMWESFEGDPAAYETARGAQTCQGSL
ncbi:uncharacterized protein PAC_12186 [Phialocephala subalpina]|uniref:AIG1-type G domain-containing protein n=1 Tax=Phialocephala subalpina TaxID=576137 RepID=A0A1L7XB91_9HELO|nr:uncharacterized protein PAC_12186 [Phialocephala subalpina]